jgi:hypothetical protein
VPSSPAPVRVIVSTYLRVRADPCERPSKARHT